MPVSWRQIEGLGRKDADELEPAIGNRQQYLEYASINVIINKKRIQEVILFWILKIINNIINNKKS